MLADLAAGPRVWLMRDRPKKPSEKRPDDSPDRAADVPDWLGTQLRDLYSDVMNEPIPDQFRDLLKQLEEKGKK
jgi:hypothetical protein